MKNMIVAAALIVSGVMASAQFSADDLASNMKVMSSKLKAIAEQVKNPALNTNSAKLADEFTVAAHGSKQFVPDTVAALPPKDQPARKALFDQMLDTAVSQGQKLAAALRANDNARAVEILKLLSQTKKDGHAEFRKEK